MPSRRRHVGDYSRRHASPKEPIKMMTFCLARLPTNVDAAAYSGGVLGPNASIETARTHGHTHGRRDGGIAPGDAGDADDTFQRWAVVATMTDRNWPPVDRANRASKPKMRVLPLSPFLPPAPGPRAASRMNTRPRGHSRTADPTGVPESAKTRDERDTGEREPASAFRRISNLTPGKAWHPPGLQFQAHHSRLHGP